MCLYNYENRYHPQAIANIISENGQCNLLKRWSWLIYNTNYNHKTIWPGFCCLHSKYWGSKFFSMNTWQQSCWLARLWEMMCGSFAFAKGIICILLKRTLCKMEDIITCNASNSNMVDLPSEKMIRIAINTLLDWMLFLWDTDFVLLCDSCLVAALRKHEPASLLLNNWQRSHKGPLPLYPFCHVSSEEFWIRRRNNLATCCGKELWIDWNIVSVKLMSDQINPDVL